MSGPCLLHVENRRRLIRTDDFDLRPNIISEATVLFDGVDGDIRFVLVALHLQVKFIVLGLTHGLSNQLRPEFSVSIPAQPIAGPSILDVGCKSDRLSEAVLPPG